MSLDFPKRSARKILERIIPVAKRSGIVKFFITTKQEALQTGIHSCVYESFFFCKEKTSARMMLGL
jgi:hypothetical protein